MIASSSKDQRTFAAPLHGRSCDNIHFGAAPSTRFTIFDGCDGASSSCSSGSEGEGSLSSYLSKLAPFQRPEGLSAGEFVAVQSFAKMPEVPDTSSVFPDLKIVALCQGYPQIFLARSRSGQGSYCVLKVSSADAAARREARQKSGVREVFLQRYASHESLDFLGGREFIVHLRDFRILREGDLVISALEHCRYGSLLLFLTTYGDKIYNAEKMQFAMDFTRALVYLHEFQIAHRDVKLDNVFLTWCVTKKRVVAKLGDFGASSLCTQLTYEGANVSSEFYMAPELIVKSFHNPLFADRWAWAVTLYWLFEGRCPFDDVFNSPRTRVITTAFLEPVVMHSVPSFAALFDQFFVVDPEQRPALKNVLSSGFMATYPRSEIKNENVGVMMSYR